MLLQSCLLHFSASYYHGQGFCVILFTYIWVDSILLKEAPLCFVDCKEENRHKEFCDGNGGDDDDGIGNLFGDIVEKEGDNV